MNEIYESEADEPEVAEVEEIQIDNAQIQSVIYQIRSEQNLMLGTIAGAIAALVGASIWAAITVATEFQIGWMAIGVGFMVGGAIRAFGKGVDNVFGIVGAVLTLVGCIGGNLLAMCGLLAVEVDVGFFVVVSRLTPQIAYELLVATFHPMDLLFYGIAVYEGYKLSFRQLTDLDIVERIPGLGTADSQS
jgi:hypothetical protein